MKLDKNYKVRVTPEQSREIHSLILLEGGEVSYGLKPQLQDEFLVVENDHGSVVIYYTDQDIFQTIENQEIQADDLIALLTDLSKSAENPLQKMELTPKPDAVERPLTLVEKLEPILDDLMMECFKHGFHQSEMTEAEFIDYSRKNCVPLKREIISILKQHEAESEVQDETA